MKKLNRILIYIFVFIPLSTLFSQTRDVQIIQKQDGLNVKVIFEKQPYILDGKNGNIINFYNAVDESKPGSPILPSKTFFIAIPPNSKAKVSIIDEKVSKIKSVIPRSNPKVLPESDSSLTYSETKISSKYYKSNIYPKTEFEIVGYTWMRDYYCMILKVNTHRYNWSSRQISELREATIEIKFTDVQPFTLNTSIKSDFDETLKDIIINYDQAEQFRSRHKYFSINDSTGSWIDYSQQYVKLAISEDGIYRIGYNELINYGIDPSSLNPSKLKIINKGNEIPLFVFGEDDNSFDPGDYIEFWATKNYGAPNYRTLVEKGEEYLEYMDRYTDTSFVWLSWEGEDGLRTMIENNYVQNLTDSITTHLTKIHLEQNNVLWFYGFVEPRVQLPFWQENKYWKWLQVSNTSNKKFEFEAESIVPNTPVFTQSRLSSWFVDTQIIWHNAHKYGAKMNATGIIDSVTFDFEDQANLQAIFNSNDLIEGINKYKIAGMPNDSNSTNRALVDWVDIDYYQYTNAVNDSLLINIPDSVSANLRVIKVNNISVSDTSLLIYKIDSIRKRITNFQIIDSVLTFTDTVSSGDRYFVLSTSYLMQPEFRKKKQFINLRNPSKQADYLIVSNKLLQSSVSDYANFISSNYSINVETAFVDDIYDEFGFGYFRPEAIRGFLKYMHDNWQQPLPSYLTIIGDATYDYKDYFVDVPSPRKKIIVPSYGDPVSDVWFTTWDTSQVDIQQMFVGRIPANNNEEVYRYLDKHQTYLDRDFDEWNKEYLLFSGGDPNLISELNQIRQVNENLLNSVIKPAPVGGDGTHFYKTVDPPTNFGPYTFEEIQAALDKGGLFISYVGHSGTRTWDNGVTDVDDIENAYDDRLPLITDNGCSTGKFAEPDVDAFGELFLNQDVRGQAIIYIGNSSLGYTSTAFRMPDLFYTRLIVNPGESIGESQFLAKMDNFNQTGFSETNRLYGYCSVLLGDPIIKFKTPLKPNYVTKPDFIQITNSVLTENDDSANVNLVIGNFGRVLNDSLTLNVSDVHSDSTIFSFRMTIPTPKFEDTLNLEIPIFGLVGEHILKVELDPENTVDELSKDDNVATTIFLVSSSTVRPLLAENYYNSKQSSVLLLNPTIYSESNPNELQLEYAANDSFFNPTTQIKILDTLITRVPLTGLIPQMRYFWHTRLNDDELQWGSINSFYNEMDNSWLFSKSFRPDDIVENKVMFDSSTSKWKLVNKSNILKITSAGFNDGMFASIQYNFIEFVPNTFFRGFATAYIDTFDLHPYNIKIFNYYEGQQKDSLLAYLDTIQTGTVLTIAGSDEVSVYFGGTVGDSLKQVIKSFGSTFVDSIGWRDSWCMIGIKGSPVGTALEDFSKSTTGTATIDTSKESLATNGYLQLPKIQNSVEWQRAFKTDSIPSGASLDYIVRGYKSDNSIDTLGSLTFVSDSADLSFIDAKIYPKIDFAVQFTANESFESPKFKSLGCNFIPPPELGTNYQVVSSTADTVLIGEDVGLQFYVYNVGESAADSFNVKVEIINEDNSRNTIFEQTVDSLGSEQRKLFNVTYNTSSGTGEKTFLINIDSDNKITELYEDNNFYTVPFYIKPDTSRPSLEITFNGNDILNGEYISSNPEIRIELNDETLLPINDTSAVTIFLNDVPVYYASNPNILTYEFNSENPKVVVTYKPVLEDGDYYLTVFGKNSLDNIADSSGLEKHFLVSNEAKLLYVYNYPNPTSGETYFTFKLTQIPDEIRIRIFTIAGRLIKEIDVPSTDLRYDFNKIYWDGRDADGDILANGVYLYKVILTAGTKQEGITQKLAIVR